MSSFEARAANDVVHGHVRVNVLTNVASQILAVDHDEQEHARNLGNVVGGPAIFRALDRQLIGSVHP
jgi:hypothetical protein